MRRGLFALVLGAFLLWAIWKVVPFLGTKQPEIFATPTVQPLDESTLALVAVKKHQRVCLDGMEYGPKARYVFATLRSTRPSGSILVEARAAGYAARGRHAPGLSGNAPFLVPIEPAPREVDRGTLCLTNEGRHKVSFYGVNPGRGTSPATTTVNGKPVPQQLSVTLLTSPSKSLGGRLGEIFGHVAAFRPVTSWEVWVLALIALVGVPVALGVALARSAAVDDADASPPYDSARR
jgi:hypothetical protein